MSKRERGREKPAGRDGKRRRQRLAERKKDCESVYADISAGEIIIELNKPRELICSQKYKLVSSKKMRRLDTQC